MSVANGSMCRGWGGEVDGHKHATLNQHRETTAGESGADEIEQGSPCLVRREGGSVLDHEADEMLGQTLEVAVRGACGNEFHSQPGVHRGGTGRVQERLLFKERGEQVRSCP